MSTKTDTPTARAEQMLALAAEHGLHLSIGQRREVIEVNGSTAPGDLAEFTAKMSAAREILRLVRMVRPGSTWGTTTDGVGGHAGLTGGYVRLAKSGIEKNVANALAKRGVYAR